MLDPHIPHRNRWYKRMDRNDTSYPVLTRTLHGAAIGTPLQRWMSEAVLLDCVPIEANSPRVLLSSVSMAFLIIRIRHPTNGVLRILQTINSSEGCVVIWSFPTYGMYIEGCPNAFTVEMLPEYDGFTRTDRQHAYSMLGIPVHYPNAPEQPLLASAQHIMRYFMQVYPRYFDDRALMVDESFATRFKRGHTRKESDSDAMITDDLLNGSNDEPVDSDILMYSPDSKRMALEAP